MSVPIWTKVKNDKPIRTRVWRQVTVNGVTRPRRIPGVVPDEVALGNQPPEKWRPVSEGERR